MELRTALESLSPITSQRMLDTLPALQNIELYADPDGNITGAMATDRYVLARYGVQGEPAAYVSPVQAKQLLAQLKANSYSMIQPILDREAGTILGIPVTMPDDMAGQFPSAATKILDEALAKEETQLPLGTGISLSIMELVVKILKPLNRGKSSRNRSTLGLRLAARDNVLVTTVDELTLLVMPLRLHD